MTKPRFLLDTNICIYLLDGSSDEARARVELCKPGEVVTSAVAYAEVIRGISDQTGGPQGRAEAFFEVVTVLPFDSVAARCYRKIAFKRGTFDRLIAAHALALDLTFVTNNERDFANIERLVVENWTRK